MNKEKDNEFKINVPLMTQEELKTLDNILENDIDNFVNQITKTILKDKENIILQKTIDKLQKKIREYEYNIAEIVLTREDNFISKDKIRAKMKEIKNLCLNCGFRETFCNDLKRNRQCVTNEIIIILENLLKGE